MILTKVGLQTYGCKDRNDYGHKALDDRYMNLKFLSDDPKHSLDGSEASHKLLLSSVHLVDNIMIDVMICIMIITATILTWQARLLSRKMPAR